MAETIVEVEVDTVPQAADPSSTAKHTVRVMLMNKRRQLYIHEGDLDWLLAYMADEVAYGGVVMNADDLGPAVAEPNSRIAGLHIEWDFHREGWGGRFLSGPLVGQKFFSKAAAMTSHKWSRLLAHKLVDGSLSTASPDDLDEAAKQYLELHCEGLLS